MNDEREKGLAEWVRLTACPGCEYSLEGLAAEGVCPECGRGYDGRYVVVWGRGRGRLDGVAGGTWRAWVGQGVAVAILLWFFLGGRLRVANFQMVAMACMVGMMLVTGLYSRLFSAREPRMQLWMLGEGVAQCLSTPEGRRVTWLATVGWRWFLPVFVLAPMVQLLRLPMRSVVVAVGVYVMIGLLVWRRTARRREEGGGYRPALTGWGEVEEVRVEGLSGGRARIMCRVPEYWGPVLVNDKVWKVDIEVACPAGVVEGVRGMMEGWRVAARGGVRRKAKFIKG